MRLSRRLDRCALIAAQRPQLRELAGSVHAQLAEHGPAPRAEAADRTGDADRPDDVAVAVLLDANQRADRADARGALLQRLGVGTAPGIADLRQDGGHRPGRMGPNGRVAVRR